MDFMTIAKMFANRRCIEVPDYQRAYSWDTTKEGSEEGVKQVNQFFMDIENYIKNPGKSNYYLGHFLFERKAENKYAVIDGQQRLTTIIIYLSVLFRCLKELRKNQATEKLTDEEIEEREKEDYDYATIVKSGDRTYRFKTTSYDNQLFKDYVINGQMSKSELLTASQERLTAAYDFFKKQTAQMDEIHIKKVIQTITNARCTDLCIDKESDAIQMFILQNNRGKEPTNLEILKALFLYKICSLSDDENTKNDRYENVRGRFEQIYYYVAKTEKNLSEDEILANALRVYEDKLWIDQVMKEIESKIENDATCLDFIEKFTLRLELSFSQLSDFYAKSKENCDYQALTRLGQRSVWIPFILKAKTHCVSDDDFLGLIKSLEMIIVRDRIIGTRADLSSRLSETFKNFKTADIRAVLEQINSLKKSEGWAGYWNDREFDNGLSKGIFSTEISKFILWKYENSFYEELKYKGIPYDNKFQLEHIAPQTENLEPDNGYGKYKIDITESELYSIGNCILVTGAHNGNISNKKLSEKLKTYNKLHQQREICELVQIDHLWDARKIRSRKSKLIKFIKKLYA